MMARGLADADVAIHQGRDDSLGVYRLVFGLVLLTAVFQQVHRRHLVIQPFQVERNAHPVCSGRSPVAVHFHD